jgi:hypothetical protein
VHVTQKGDRGNLKPSFPRSCPPAFTAATCSVPAFGWVVVGPHDVQLTVQNGSLTFIGVSVSLAGRHTHTHTDPTHGYMHACALSLRAAHYANNTSCLAASARKSEFVP